MEADPAEPIGGDVAGYEEVGGADAACAGVGTVMGAGGVIPVAPKEEGVDLSLSDSRLPLNEILLANFEMLSRLEGSASESVVVEESIESVGNKEAVAERLFLSLSFSLSLSLSPLDFGLDLNKIFPLRASGEGNSASFRSAPGSSSNLDETSLSPNVSRMI